MITIFLSKNVDTQWEEIKIRLLQTLTNDNIFLLVSSDLDLHQLVPEFQSIKRGETVNGTMVASEQKNGRGGEGYVVHLLTLSTAFTKVIIRLVTSSSSFPK